ncbi:MAG: TolC family protein [Polyangiales bacterium]
MTKTLFRLAQASGALLLCVLAACARDHGDANSRVAAALDSSGGDARVRAAAARYRSARERADSVSGHEDMQLRVRGLSGENFDREQGVGISVRIPMTNPWEIARTRDARSEEAMAMAHAVESEALSVASTRCTEGLTRSAALGAADAQRRFHEAMTSLQTWSEGWVRGETLGPLENAELTLEIERRMAELVTPPVSEGDTVPLPPLVASPPLDARLETIRERVQTAHPAMEQHAAAARAYRALARRERARAAPWFGFVEFGYEFERARLDNQDRQAIEARFAITVPLAMRPRHAIARQEARAEAEELDATAASEELAREAAIALAGVSSFALRATSLSSLRERADESETMAVRYLEERHGDPRSVLGVLVEVLRTRLAVLDAQRRAGLAACDLYMSTGVAAADWPRQ